MGALRAALTDSVDARRLSHLFRLVEALEPIVDDAVASVRPTCAGIKSAGVGSTLAKVVEMVALKKRVDAAAVAGRRNHNAAVRRVRNFVAHHRVATPAPADAWADGAGDPSKARDRVVLDADIAPGQGHRIASIEGNTFAARAVDRAERQGGAGTGDIHALRAGIGDRAIGDGHARHVKSLDRRAL